MAGAFETWWNAIVDGVGDSIDGAAIKFHDQANQGKFDQGSPPAINMRFVDDSYGPPKSARGGRDGADPIWTSETRIGLHIWGNDPDQAHELRRRVIVAIHNVAGHRNYRPEAGAWNTGTVVTVGCIYVFSMIWDIPIARDAEGTAAINEFDNDLGIQT